MKCPHCGYQAGVYWDEQNQLVKAEEGHGTFFKSPIVLVRGSIFRSNVEEVIMCGCPRCMKTFIEVE